MNLSKFKEGRVHVTSLGWKRNQMQAAKRLLPEHPELPYSRSCNHILPELQSFKISSISSFSVTSMGYQNCPSRTCISLSLTRQLSISSERDTGRCVSLVSYQRKGQEKIQVPIAFEKKKHSRVLIYTQIAFYLNLYRTVIGLTGFLAGR